MLPLIERIHGHLAWLSIAALLHPVIVLSKPVRRARLACWLATLLATVAAALGVSMYSEYRRVIRHPLFLESPRLGWMFERKEHMTAGVVLLAWVGLAAHIGSLRCGEQARSAFWRTARTSYSAAFVLALLSGIIGVAVASHRSF